MLKITSNRDEYSRSTENLDIVAFKDVRAPELILYRKDSEEQIILTPQEVSVLLTHLNDPRTQAVFNPL